EAKITLAAPKKRHENLLEVLTNLHERGEKELARLCVDFADGLLKRQFGSGKISALRSEQLESFLLLLVFFNRERVYRSERLDLVAKLSRLGTELLVTG